MNNSRREDKQKCKIPSILLSKKTFLGLLRVWFPHLKVWDVQHSCSVSSVHSYSTSEHALVTCRVS